MQLEIMLRAAGASTLLLTAAVLLLSAPRAPVARWFLPFALGIAGFLGVNTAFDAAELAEPVWSIASFLSRMAAVFLWLFCLVLFDGRLRAPAAALAVSSIWLALVVIDKGYLAPAPADVDVSSFLLVIGTGLVLHAGWRVLHGLRDDLIDRRRRARPLFALALLVFLSLDFAVDALQGYGWRPASFLLLQNAVLLVLAVGLGLWLLRPQRWLMGTAPTRGVPMPPAEAVPDPDLVVLDRVQAVMHARRPYLDPELSFAQFASLVGLPEPAIRRAINHRLGHGQFRHFLNGYRVEEAKRRLRDPASAGDKILAVALDSGFSSLASFNRVFRQTVGCAPSEYRSGSPAAPAPDRSPDGW
jgi:AraC-like DNA-binding protein